MQNRGGLACQCPCAEPGLAARIAHRQLLKSAVFPHSGGDRRGAASALLPGVVTGTVLDVSPHVLVVGSAGGEHRLMLTARVAVWRGGPAEPTSLRAGEPVVARLVPGRRDIAGKLWSGIGRVTGTIVEAGSYWLRVDGGRAKRHQDVVISPRAANQIKVRFPQLEPGNLIDVIGLRRDGTLEALVPATAQPAHLAHRVNRSAVARRAVSAISGSATWHEPAGGDDAAEGVDYPAIDPATDCAQRAGTGPAASVMPYLAVGSMLLVRNDCTGAWRTLPVTGCGAVARMFSDRCLTCGTSPRGRIADLTLASFVELGGDLEHGCFNATVSTGAAR